MRWVLVMSVLLGSVALAEDEKAKTYRFSKNDEGKVPAGWTADKTGKGEGSIWKVVADDTSPSKSGFALAQTAVGPGGLFNLCIVNDSNFKDVEISVAFKAVKGDSDQGGGIVWRYQDNNNYYVARMNPLEDNYRLYHVVAGKRVEFARKEGIKIPPGEWHTLKIEMEGDEIECCLDGKKELESHDNTITKAGKIGLWTKADSQSHFDDFKASGK